LKQFVKKIVDNFFAFIFFIFVFSCAGKYQLNNFYGKTELILNKVQLDRFNNYLKGEYYSNELNRKVSHRPIMFAISADGSTSLIFSCASISTECNLGVNIYQLLKRYSKKSNKEMFIFALKNKIVWSGNNYVVKENKLNDSNKLLFNVNFNLKDKNLSTNKLYDVSILPIDDDDFEN
jgi:hypothetical protein